MSYEVSRTQTTSQPIALVRARVGWSELSTRIPAMLQPVWEFLRARQLELAPSEHGHNVCIYRDPRPESVELEAGVLLARPFEAADGVLCGALPEGPAAVVQHVGDYAQLRLAYEALEAWVREHGGRTGGIFWERYGDWDEDPARRFTWVYRQL